MNVFHKTVSGSLQHKRIIFHSVGIPYQKQKSTKSQSLTLKHWQGQHKQQHKADTELS